MELKIGQLVLISDRYNGMVWEVVIDEVDEWGEFTTVDNDGDSHGRHVDDIDQVQ